MLWLLLLLRWIEITSLVNGGGAILEDIGTISWLSIRGGIRRIRCIIPRVHVSPGLESPKLSAADKRPRSSGCYGPCIVERAANLESPLLLCRWLQCLTFGRSGGWSGARPGMIGRDYVCKLSGPELSAMQRKYDGYLDKNMVGFSELSKRLQ